SVICEYSQELTHRNARKADLTYNYNKFHNEEVVIMLPKLRLFSIVLLLLFAFSLASPLSAAQSNNDKIAAIDAYFTKLTSANIFSGSVLIAYKGDVLLDKGYGLASRDWDTPNAPDTRFQIDSLTKQFTAMSILMLQEQGKLNIEDHACQYI